MKVLSKGGIVLSIQESIYDIQLAPFVVAIPTDASGNNPVLTGAKCKLVVTYQRAVVASVITGLVPTNCSATFAANVVQLTSVTADAGEVLINFAVEGKPHSAVFTWSKARQGVTGGQGQSGYTVLLSNEAQTLPANSSGFVSAAEIARATSKIMAYKGATALSAVAANATPVAGQFRYNIASVTGGTANRVDNENLVLASINANSETTAITISINCENVATVTKVLTITKARAGTDVPPGTVDQLEADIQAALAYADNVAQSKADVAKAAAISAASTDAQNKATAARQAAELMATQLANGIKFGGRNYVMNSKVSTANVGQLSGGTCTWETDPKYGLVPEYTRAAGGGDFQFVFPVNFEPLRNTEAVYIVIAKSMTAGSAFSFGGWPETSANLTQSSTNIDLGDGWKMYWTTFTVSDLNSGNTVGINSVSGKWRFYAVGAFKGNKPADWMPAPEDVTAAIKVANDTATAAQTAYTKLTNSLQFLNIPELQALALQGKTLIQNGLINTVMLDAQAIRANIINADYINTIEVVSKMMKTALSGARIEISGNSNKAFFPSGVLARAQVVEDGIVKDIWYNPNGDRVQDLSYRGTTYVQTVPESWTLTKLRFLTASGTATPQELADILSGNVCYKPAPEYVAGRIVGVNSNKTAHYYNPGKNINSGAFAAYEGYKNASGSRNGDNIPDGWYVMSDMMLYTNDGNYYDLSFLHVVGGKLTGTSSITGVYLNATQTCSF